jgi:hypothetical protein
VVLVQARGEAEEACEGRGRGGEMGRVMWMGLINLSEEERGAVPVSVGGPSTLRSKTGRERLVGSGVKPTLEHRATARKSVARSAGMECRSLASCTRQA